MKSLIVFVVLVIARLAGAQSLPAITTSPVNITVSPGTTATFTVVATGATAYQWMFNGTNISGATSSTLQVGNAQATNCGYYSVIVKNAVGCVPSALAYLFIDYTSGGLNPTACGTLPLSNTNDTYFAGDIDLGNGPSGTIYPTNGTVRIVAGPQLDEMSPVGNLISYHTAVGLRWFTNGFYQAPDQIIPNMAPGQVIYYSVNCLETNTGFALTNLSTVMLLNAGTNGSPASSSYGLKFPGWFLGEGPEPTYSSTSPTNQLRVANETFSFSVHCFGYPDYGVPTCQWRKNGILIGNRQSFILDNPPESAQVTTTLTISNAQPSDAGVYDLDIRGSLWYIGPKIYVSIMTTNGPGFFMNPKKPGTNFVCNLIGAPGRNYMLQSSTNLLNWSNVTTVSNLTGTVTFTNAPGTNSPIFYRTVLQSF